MGKKSNENGEVVADHKIERGSQMLASSLQPYVISPSMIDHGEFPPPMQIIKPDGNYDSELEPDYSSELLHEMYRWLVLTRELDTRLLNLQRQGRIGFYAPCTGEEAVQVGSAMALQKGDWCAAQYREPGAALVRGLPLFKLVCNMFGNVQDPLQGRQMPCHFGSWETRFLPASSPVGTQIAIAIGLAWAAKIKGEPDVTLAYFGEGATSEGDFHVSCNMAGVFKLPLVFFCKNNQYAISVPWRQQTASETIAQKAIAYGFEGVRVDGNDALAVYQVTKDAAAKAREGGGPTLIEAMTYRLGPHSTADDPRRYRKESEVEEAKLNEPLLRFRLYLERKGLWDARQESDLRGCIAQEVDDNIQSAEKMENPPLESIFHDVYAEMPWHIREQMGEIIADPTRAHSENPTWGKESDDYKFP